MSRRTWLACLCACVGVQKGLYVCVTVSLCVPLSDAQLCVGSCVPPLSFFEETCLLFWPSAF